MKTLLPLALLALSTSLFAQTSIPFYFAVTPEAMAPADRNFRKIPIKGVETEQGLLKGYVVHDPHELVRDPSTGEPKLSRSPRATVAAKKRLRATSTQELYKRGLLKTGDIVLSFRPLWERTTPYSHVQMGVSHAGIIYVENGVAKNLDMPLDAIHSGERLESQLDAEHYLEAEALHIVRPRNFSATQQKNLLEWIKLLKTNAANIRAAGLLSFNSDYTAPKFENYGPADDAFVTTMGKIITRQNRTAKNLNMYCSEFAWAMLSLASCTPTELQNETSEDASCVQPIFAPLPIVSDGNLPGLGEGPLMLLENLDISVSQKMELLQDLFYEGRVDLLSRNHRALATNDMIKQLVGLFRIMYPAKLSGASSIPFPQPNTPIGAAAQFINSNGKRNYSPTAYVINAMLEKNHPERKFDYVGTFIYSATR
jgi:hypothetical protein